MFKMNSSTSNTPQSNKTPALTTSLQRMLIWLTCILVLFGGISTGSAQEGLPSAEELLAETNKRLESQRRKPVPASNIQNLNVRVHWRLWKRVISEGKSGKNELRVLHDDLASLGIRNHPSYVLASIAWIKQQETDKAISKKLAAEAMEDVSLLGPDMPHPYLAHAKILLTNSPGEVGLMTGQAKRGLERMWSWPGMGATLRYNLIVFLLLSVLLGGSFYLLGQLVRYFSIISHDAARMMPKGFSTNQTLLVLMGVLIVPGLVLQSPLISIFILLLMLSVVQQPNERIATALMFVILLLIPQLEQRMSNEATYHQSDSKALLTAQYMDCDIQCKTNLKGVIERQAAKGGKPDRMIEYTQMYRLYRDGKTKAITDKWTYDQIKVWPTSIKGHGLNLYGAALVAQIKIEDAIKPLKQAASLLRHSPAPHVNLMRAYQIDQKKEEALKHLDEANKRGLLETVSFLKYQQRDINSFLWVLPLDITLFYKRHIYIEKPKQLPIIRRIWPYLAGRTIPISASFYMGLLGLAVLILTLPLSLKGAMSTPCPKCGLARDPEDGAKTADHDFCALCYNTYIAGAQYNYQTRVNNEERINARNANMRITKRLLSVAAPGTGHAIAGYGVLSFLISFGLFFGLFCFMLPGGLWQAPHGLLVQDWVGVRYLAGAMLLTTVVAGIYGAAKDIDPKTPITKKHGRVVHNDEEVHKP